MPTKMNNASKMNNSILTSSSVHDTDILSFNNLLSIVQSEFNVEKDAKNKVYAFILSRGLLNEFEEFSKHYSSNNPHLDCLDMVRLYTSDND